MWRALNAHSCSTINLRKKIKRAALHCQLGKSHYSPASASSSHTSYVSGRVQEACKNRRSTKQKQKQGQRSELWCRNQQIGRASGCSSTAMWCFLQTTAKFIQLNNFLAFYTFEVVLTPHLLLYSIHYVQPIIIQSSELILRLLTLKIPVWRIIK